MMSKPDDVDTMLQRSVVQERDREEETARKVSDRC